MQSNLLTNEWNKTGVYPTIYQISDIKTHVI